MGSKLCCRVNSFTLANLGPQTKFRFAAINPLLPNSSAVVLKHVGEHETADGKLPTPLFWLDRCGELARFGGTVKFLHLDVIDL